MKNVLGKGVCILLAGIGFVSFANDEENLLHLTPPPTVSWVTWRNPSVVIGTNSFVLTKKATDKEVRVGLVDAFYPFYPGYVASGKVRLTFEYRGGSGRMAVVSHIRPMENLHAFAPTYVEGPFWPAKDWKRYSYEITMPAHDIAGCGLRIVVSEGAGVLEVRNIRLEESVPARTGGRSFLVGGEPVTEVALLATDDPLRHEHELRAARMFRYVLYRNGGTYLPVRTVRDLAEIGPNAVLIGRAAVAAGVVSEEDEKKHLADFDCGCARRVKGTRLGIVGGFPGGPQYGVWRLFRQLGVEYLGAESWRCPAGDAAFVAPDEPDDMTPAVACRISHYHNRGGHMPELRGRVFFERLMCNFSYGMPKGGTCGVDHSMARALVPMGEFFATRPDFFAVDATGKRQPANTHPGMVQYCLSNPDLAKLTGERLIELMRANPCAKLFPISPGDGSGNDCKCAHCKALGTTSDVWMTFFNRVAEVTSREFPDRYLHMTSYVDTPEAPKSGIRPHPNVNGDYCIYPRSYWPSCLVWDHWSNDRGRAAIAGWRKIIPRIALIYYPMQCSRWMDYWPSFDMDVAVVRDFARARTIYTRYFGIAPVHGVDLPQMGSFCDLRLHVLGRLEEDPEVAVEPLIDAFMRDFYGPAADPMRALFDRLRGECARRGWIQNCELFRWGLVTPELGRECLSLLDRAEAAGNAEIRRHVLREKQNFLWTYLSNVSIGRGNVSAAERADWVARLGEFCRIAGETEVAHMGNGGAAYSRQWFHDIAFLTFPKGDDFERWPKVAGIREIGKDPAAAMERYVSGALVLTNGSYVVRAKDIAGCPDRFTDTRRGFPEPACCLRRASFGSNVASMLVDLKPGEAGARELFVSGAANENTRMTLAVNGVEVYSGNAPFGNNGWQEKSFVLPEGALKPGRNTIVLRNLTGDETGKTGREAMLEEQKPYWGWIDVEYVRIPVASAGAVAK